MNARERVLSAVAHKEPDRVPIDQGSMRSTGITAIAYNLLKRHLGSGDSHTYLYDVVQQLAEPEPWYLDRFQVDVVDLGRAFASRDWREWTLPDGSRALAPAWFEATREDGGLTVRHSDGTIIGKMPAGATGIDQTFWPLTAPDALDCYEPLGEKMQYVTWGALPSSPWDEPLTPSRLEEIGTAARILYESTDRAISLSLGCSLLEWSQFLFGMEQAYLFMAGEKRRFARFLDSLTEMHLDFLDRVLPAVRGYVQILVFGDDLGTQRGPQISRAMYRELFFPRHRKLYDCARRLSGAHIFLHSCGGIFELIPDLIDAGVEILNPVQTSARNMDPVRLKKEFGKDVTFWGGGCDTQKTLPYGTPQDVKDDVRRRLDIFMAGGGYVWNQIHNIMADVPPGNIEAMLEAAIEYGRYNVRT
ncbi:MAG: methyltransferase [Acidobacteria bacterium]|nr:methyltransferase [Acidobacteriota bacterium]